MIFHVLTICRKFSILFDRILLLIHPILDKSAVSHFMNFDFVVC